MLKIIKKLKWCNKIFAIINICYIIVLDGSDYHLIMKKIINNVMNSNSNDNIRDEHN